MPENHRELSPFFREEVRPEDRQAVGRLVRATGFFSEEEIGIAVELVEERLARGDASGYFFLFAEEGDRLLGYACFGPIPGTRRTASTSTGSPSIPGSRDGGSAGR